MAWICLVLAGILEMLSVGLIHKLHQDRSWKTLAFLIAGFMASFLFLTVAMKSLPMGTAYAIWTGIGASGGALLGIILYGEEKSFLRILFITMILSAAIGLKLIS